MFIEIRSDIVLLYVIYRYRKVDSSDYQWSNEIQLVFRVSFGVHMHSCYIEIFQWGRLFPYKSGVAFWDDYYPHLPVDLDSVDLLGGFNVCMLHLTDWQV